MRKQIRGITLRKVFVETPLGDLTPEDISEKGGNLAYGPYFGHDNVMGNMVYWHLPGFTEQSCKNLKFCIENIDNFEKLRSEYEKLIKVDPVIKWHLIFVLICASDSNLKESLLYVSELPDWSTEKLFKNKKLFHSLVEYGAEYKHFLSEGYKEVGLSHFLHYLNIFGKEATVGERRELNFLINFIIHDEYQKMELALKAGANINDRIDYQFNNTPLHYLIALEDESGAIKLINFLEKIAKDESSDIVGIDYTAQDINGRTPLSLAVGLGLQRVVDRLIEIQVKKHKEIGINTPDSEGRVPAMIAGALGRSRIFDLLLSHGAAVNLRDHKDRSIKWYVNAPIQEVRAILESLSVHPDRGCYCKAHSYLYAETKVGIPWVAVDNEGKEHLLLLSPKNEHLSLLMLVLDNVPQEKKFFIIAQIKPLLKDAGSNYQKTIAQVCQEKQRRTQCQLEQHSRETGLVLGSDVFATNARHSKESVQLYNDDAEKGFILVN